MQSHTASAKIIVYARHIFFRRCFAASLLCLSLCLFTLTICSNAWAEEDDGLGNTDAAYAQCLNRCDEAGRLAYITREGCEKGCEEAWRNMEPQRHKYSQYAQCLDAAHEIEVDQANYLAKHDAWCRATFYSVYDLKGCENAGKVFYGSLKAGTFCADTAPIPGKTLTGGALSTPPATQNNTKEAPAATLIVVPQDTTQSARPAAAGAPTPSYSDGKVIDKNTPPAPFPGKAGVTASTPTTPKSAAKPTPAPVSKKPAVQTTAQPSAGIQRQNTSSQNPPATPAAPRPKTPPKSSRTAPTVPAGSFNKPEPTAAKTATAPAATQTTEPSSPVQNVPAQPVADKTETTAPEPVKPTVIIPDAATPSPAPEQPVTPAVATPSTPSAVAPPDPANQSTPTPIEPAPTVPAAPASPAIRPEIEAKISPPVPNQTNRMVPMPLVLTPDKSDNNAPEVAAPAQTTRVAP